MPSSPGGVAAAAAAAAGRAVAGTFSMEARSGRARQVYADGVRQVVGCVPVRGNEVLLVTSRGKHEWILPKGGWENDETQQQSAAREAWEEGGVRGLVGRHLVSVDLRHRKTPSTIHFYELSVDEEALAWPERDQRTRRWVPIHEAARVLKRPEMLAALAAMESTTPGSDAL